MQSLLRKSLIVSGIALSAVAFGQNASADSSDILRWQTVNGIVATNTTVGTGAGLVNGGPTPWSTLDGHVNVDLAKGKMAGAGIQQHIHTPLGKTRTGACGHPRILADLETDADAATLETEISNRIADAIALDRA